MTDNKLNSPKKNIKTIIFTLCAVAAIVLVYIFAIKPLLTLYNTTGKSKLGLDNSYKQVAVHCPTNIELELVCIRNYYSANTTPVIEKTITDMLKKDGFNLRKLQKGYDGPNQVAYMAYNQKKNVSLIVVIIETDNDTYKKSMGNIRVDAYLGQK